MKNKRLTVEYLRMMTSTLESSAKKDGLQLDNHMRMYALALRILDHFLGEDWVRANIVEKVGGSDYFRASAENEDRYKNSARVLTFAEMLLNLQDIEGFPDRISEMRTRNVESAIAEVQGAALLHATGFRIRFRAVGYDLDILLPEGHVAIEIKRKLESTKLSPETVKNTLEEARKQLPGDRAGLIFLNLPEGWVKCIQVEEIMKSTLQAFFRATGRVVTVVLWWEEFVQQGGGWWRLIRMREERNPYARFLPGPVKDLVALTYQAATTWTYLNVIVTDTIQGVEDGSIIRYQ